MARLKKTDYAPEMEKEFVLLLERHNETIRSVCRHYYPDDIYRMDALYNEIVFNLWNGMRMYQNRKTEAAWVNRVAINAVINNDKGEKRLPVMVPISQKMEEELMDYDGNHMLEKLFALIELLDSKEKTVIEMYLDHVPQAEIASRLGMSETNVSTMVNRIKLKLKKLNNNDQE